MRSGMPLEDRKQAEATFHDRRAADKRLQDQRSFEDAYPNKKLYAVTRARRKRMAA